MYAPLLFPGIDLKSRVSLGFISFMINRFQLKENIFRIPAQYKLVYFTRQFAK